MLEMESQSSILRVLLVEDNVIAGKVAQCILQSLQCLVDVAPGVSDALACVQSQRYDLIFMDIGLPELDGFQLTAMIRQSLPEVQQSLPVIALSAHADIAKRQEYLDLAFDGAIVKPLNREKAAGVLHSFRAGTLIEPLSAEPETPEVAALAVIDLATLKKYTSSDPAIFLPLLRTFLASLPAEAALMEDAFVARDWLKFSAGAHKLNGAAGYYGAYQLKAVCGQLQHLPSDTDYLQIKDLFSQLRQAFDNLIHYQTLDFG